MHHILKMILLEFPFENFVWSSITFIKQDLNISIFIRTVKMGDANGPSMHSPPSFSIKKTQKSFFKSFGSSVVAFRHLLTSCWIDRRIRFSLFAFLIPNSSIPLFILQPKQFIRGFWAITFFHALLTLLCLYAFPVIRQRWKFSAQAFVLGFVNGWAIGLGLMATAEPIHPHTILFCLYAFVFTLFHFSEFLMTALTNPDSLRPDSFLLNHSPAYWTAAMGSWMEFWARAWAFTSFYSPFVTSIGLICCIVGELLRKLAMCHAAVGFTHQIAVRRHRDHSLCTDGVYGLVRHPGYLGWLIWSVGTQLILCNVICAQFYAFVAYKFFEDRIYEEERYLIEFFGQRYIAYQRRVPAGIPGIRGYVPHN